MRSSLAATLRYNKEHRLQQSRLGITAITAQVLGDIGVSLDDFTGTVSFYGKDPIIPSVFPYGTACAAALAAKAVLLAMIWQDKSGEVQDIHVDVRKALRQCSGFYNDPCLETMNGYAGSLNENMHNALGNRFYQTKDGKWIFTACTYYPLITRALDLLGCPNDPILLAAACARWEAAALEKAAEEAGIPMFVYRSLEEFLDSDVFSQSIAEQPLLRIEKVADSAPRPFRPGGTVLSGIRALGLAHVIAGPALGKSLALHGADVLNVRKPYEHEIERFLYTSYVGMRSCTLDYHQEAQARRNFARLLAEADVFFSNRRPGYLERYGFDLMDLCQKYHGLVVAKILFADEKGPWAQKVGFDVCIGALSGVFHTETGNALVPQMTPQIRIVCDYITGWLASVGVLRALQRRAVEGGSYKVTVSLARVACWIMSLGIFDQSYAQKTAGSTDEHMFVMPDFFTATTALGQYRGIQEAARLSLTPGHFSTVLVPPGASYPAWLKLP